MDVWNEPYWTVEEIAVWARCRDREVVNLLQTPAWDGRHAERNQYLDLRVVTPRWRRVLGEGTLNASSGRRGATPHPSSASSARIGRRV